MPKASLAAASFFAVGYFSMGGSFRLLGGDGWASFEVQVALRSLGALVVSSHGFGREIKSAMSSLGGGADSERRDAHGAADGAPTFRYAPRSRLLLLTTAGLSAGGEA